MSKRRLGKGIDALLQGQDPEHGQSSTSVVSVPIGSLVASPHQPRKQFSEEALQELAASIRGKGIIQPILAERQDDGTYEIIAGERRFRAAKLAGLEVVPVLLRSFTEAEKLEIALIENIQRQDLNPIEEAEAYDLLMTSLELTQEGLSTRLGMNRSTVANALRLLKLPETMREAVSAGNLSAGHGRALLAVTDAGLRTRLFDAIVADGMSVRGAERMVAELNAGRSEQAFAALAAGLAPGTVPAGAVPGGAAGGTAAAPTTGATAGSGAATRERAGAVVARKSIELHDFQEKLLKALGTRVKIIGSDKRGKIQIDYFSTDDLERIYEIIIRE